MIRFLLATQLATAATAQLTTSIWLPGAANANQSFLGSVVSRLGDRITFSLAFDGEAIETEYYGNGPELVTVGGTTYMAYEASAYEESDLVAKVRLECTREASGAVPACATTIQGIGLNNSVLTSGNEAVRTTMTMSGELQQYYENDFKLVITAGAEKLSPSAVASPPTVTIDSTGTQAPTKPIIHSPGTTGVIQATGAAGHSRSMIPFLAGVGAAAVFFV